MVVAKFEFQGRYFEKLDHTQYSRGIRYDLMCKQRGCFSLGVNHRCCVNGLDRT